MTYSLQIDGKEIRIKFGMHLRENIFSSFGAGESASSIKFFTIIIFYGHENWALGEGAPVAISKKDVFNWLEKAYSKEGAEEDAAQLKIAIDAYNASEIAKDVTDANEETAKKKLNPAQSPSPGGKLEVSPPELSESHTGTTTGSL